MKCGEASETVRETVKTPLRPRLPVVFFFAETTGKQNKHLNKSEIRQGDNNTSTGPTTHSLTEQQNHCFIRGATLGERTSQLEAVSVSRLCVWLRVVCMIYLSFDKMTNEQALAIERVTHCH